MSTKPAFSVIIPVYNKKPHIDRAVRSVLDQQFRDLEIILINDASSDGSDELIRSYKDERIRVYDRKQPGAGGYAARNLGIEKSQAQWIAFLDADDEWKSDHLLNINKCIKKYPKAHFFSAGWIYKKTDKAYENKFYRSNKNNGVLDIDLLDYMKACIKKQQPVWTSVACIDKRSLESPALFPAERNIKRGGDILAWLKMMCRHKRMIWSAHIGAIYHQDSINMVTKKAPSGHEISSNEIFNDLSKTLNKTEKKYLATYFNIILKHEWFTAYRLDIEGFNIRPLLYWKYDLKNSLKYFMISFLPKTIIKKIADE